MTFYLVGLERQNKGRQLVLVALVDEGELEGEHRDRGEATELAREDNPIERVLHLLEQRLVRRVDRVQEASCHGSEVQLTSVL